MAELRVGLTRPQSAQVRPGADHCHLIGPVAAARNRDLAVRVIWDRTRAALSSDRRVAPRLGLQSVQVGEHRVAAQDRLNPHTFIYACWAVTSTPRYSE
jgi:hypothetical protein